MSDKQHCPFQTFSTFTFGLSQTKIILIHAILVLQILIHCWILPGGVCTSVLHRSLLNWCPFFLTLAVLLQFTQSVKLTPQQFAKFMACDKVHTVWGIEKQKNNDIVALGINMHLRWSDHKWSAETNHGLHLELTCSSKASAANTLWVDFLS